MPRIFLEIFVAFGIFVLFVMKPRRFACSRILSWGRHPYLKSAIGIVQHDSDDYKNLVLSNLELLRSLNSLDVLFYREISEFNSEISLFLINNLSGKYKSLTQPYPGQVGQG
jgi:hypothetical protein